MRGPAPLVNIITTHTIIYKTRSFCSILFLLESANANASKGCQKHHSGSWILLHIYPQLSACSKNIFIQLVDTVEYILCVQYNSVQLYCNAVQLNVLRVVIKRTPRATSGQTVDTATWTGVAGRGSVSVSESCIPCVCPCSLCFQSACTRARLICNVYCAALRLLVGAGHHSTLV